MKLLVYSHTLQVGGSQIVAVNLAGAMQARGHEVVLAGPPGPLAAVAASKDLRVLPIPRRSDRRPSLESAIALRRLVDRERVDLVHAYSHSACIEAFLAAYLWEGLPLICSARGKMVPRPFPKSLPMIVAHGPLQEEALRTGHSFVYLMRPVVDTDANHPLASVQDLGAELGMTNHASNLVIVSRLASRLKLPGIQRTIEAVALVAKEMPVRLILVGDGDAKAQLAEQAETLNQQVGYPLVVLAGEMVDPRPAYAAADVVLGMQGGLLRGMAFAKPAIVLGKYGFSEIVSPDSVDRFLREGFYGEGDGDSAPDRLADQIVALLSDVQLREKLGLFGRDVVCENMSLHAAADQLEQIYEAHRETPARSSRLEVGLKYVGALTRQVVERLLGRDTRSGRT
jgi:hypothetical protein